MNINSIMDILLIALKFVVIPNVSPVVPKALQDSKYACKKVMFLELVTIIIETVNNRTCDKNATIRDFVTVSSGILLPKNVVSFLFLLYASKDKMHIKNVVILIPPPVEAGAAPIHINVEKIIFVPVANSLKSIVAYPALLVEKVLKIT